MTKNKANYVDGYVFLVPRKNVNAYIKLAEEANKTWMKCGALEYKECMADDLKTASMDGESGLSFKDLTRAKKDETIWFSFITYKSRADRDQVNKKVMAEMNKQTEKFKAFKMPFDMKKMAYAGFKVRVSG